MPALRALLLVMSLSLPAVGAWPKAPRAAELTLACSAVGVEYALCREGAAAWAAESGNEVRVLQVPNQAGDRLALYQQLLAAGAGDVDIMQIDIVWPGILAEHLLDLSPYLDARERAAHYPALIANNTVDGRLVALPWFADVGLLYYRRDLLETYGLGVPATWAALEDTAARIVAAERAAGEEDLLGFVFQAKAYEGLTTNALEWIDSFGGGRIVEADGRVSLNNPRAVEALETAAGWIGTVAPRGVLNYTEEEARGVFQSGKAVFMRNWPYARALAEGPDSPVRGKVGVAPLPRGGAGGKHSGALGGQALAVSRYSAEPEAAAALARYLTSRREQARRAVAAGLNPTRPDLYADERVLAARPGLAALQDSLANAVARPAGVTGASYNRVSAIFWNAVHDTLSGRGGAAANLAGAARRLERLRRREGW